ncbi:MAG: hypothetical protein V9F04_16405 [Dermatophilaceae bacterium]
MGALAIATQAPLATTVIGLILFGILHNVLELRYVLGRFGWILDGRVGLLLLTFTTGIVLVRLGGAYLGSWSRPVEIMLGYAVLAAGAAIGLGRSDPAPRRTIRFGVLGAALVGGLALSLSFPAYHFVVLTHVHNLVPLAFLWEWSRALAPRARRVFRGIQVGWVLVVPAAILLGALDRWVGPTSGIGSGLIAGLVGDGSGVVAASAWPGAPDLGLRFLVVFAFLQTMHYVVLGRLLAPRGSRDHPGLRASMAHAHDGTDLARRARRRGPARRAAHLGLPSRQDGVCRPRHLPRLPRVPRPARALDPRKALMTIRLVSTIPFDVAPPPITSGSTGIVLLVLALIAAFGVFALFMAWRKSRGR